MAETDSHTALPLPVLSPAPKLLIVCAPYYSAIAAGLIAGAEKTLSEAGATYETVDVPGALEIPTAIRLAEQGAGFEGYIALGCVIRGETTHYETVCNDSSRGLMLLGVERGLCIGNGILTCETLAQAEDRADPLRQNKGGGAAAAALHLIALKRRFKFGQGALTPPAGGDDILLAGDPGLGRTA
ncbi:MAG: 6,7-dimethyl-8-ribityllumazine synthase [Pseudomonadota bacterium]